MADFNTTVSETLRVFGVAPSDKWNQYNWNAFVWGEGTNKVTANPTVAITAGSISPSDAVAVQPQIGVMETLTLAGAPASEVLQDSAGYTYVFPSNADDGEERDPVSWSSAAAGSNSWTSGTVTSTTWS